MLGYLKKFNDLPDELRAKVSSRAAMAAIEELEKKYGLPLAALIMKVMVKEIALADLASVLLKEDLGEPAAGRLAEELKAKIFFSLGGYFSPPARSVAAAASPVRERPSEPLPLPPDRTAAKANDRQAVKGASFFFSPDDEQEIRELTKKIDLAEKTELPAEKIEANLEAIIKRAQINFGSADLADRFRQILKTYFRGIRNRLETELTLIKPFLSGGLSFDEDSARKVMVMADKIFHPVKSGEAGAKLFNGVNSKPGSPSSEPIKLLPKIRVPELEKSAFSRPPVERDAPYDFSKLAKEPTNFPGLKTEDTKHELAPLTPVRLADSPGLVRESKLKPAEAVTPAARIKPDPAPAKPKPVVFKVQEKKPSPGAEKNASFPTRPAPAGPGRFAPTDEDNRMPQVRRRFEAENLSRSQKVKVEDVKFIPRVMSPLDEIKYLDLLNFRRLDKDPQRAIDKIKSKMNLLEEESYGKKLEGIKLWRSSPVNRLYLEIGHLSIGENRPVDVIIEERKFNNSEYLTVAEFKAIMDLNKSLRF